MPSGFVPKILVLATEKCAYPAQMRWARHTRNTAPTYTILRVPSPVLFPEDFYLRCYAKGIDGIMIAACGSDCPYHGRLRASGRAHRSADGPHEEGGLEPRSDCG